MNLLKTIKNSILAPVLLLGVGIVVANAPYQQQKLQQATTPTATRSLSDYKGTHIPGFSEFRVQELVINPNNGADVLKGEPFEILINVSTITHAYPYVDKKKNSNNATVLHTTWSHDPLFVYESYKDTVSSIRKGMGALSNSSGSTITD